MLIPSGNRNDELSFRSLFETLSFIHSAKPKSSCATRNSPAYSFCVLFFFLIIPFANMKTLTLVTPKECTNPFYCAVACVNGLSSLWIRSSKRAARQKVHLNWMASDEDIFFSWLHNGKRGD